ncbi:hypothetical protein R6Q59_020079 [Mikania micrantha]
MTIPPLNKKMNPNYDSTIITDDLEIKNKNHMFPFYILLMMLNTIGSFAKAYRHGDYSMAVFNLLVLSIFVLVDFCLVKYFSMPKNEKSSRKFWLELTMWCLYTIISFGFVYLFSYYINLQTTMALYTVVLICCVVLLYVFVLAYTVSNWKVSRSEDQETLDASKSNQACLILEV